MRKWLAVFGIYFQDGLAYRASGIIWILTDVTTAVTMPLVWARATAASGGQIAGFTGGQFVLYYLCMLLVSCFVQSHIMWDLAFEIREGQFTVMLVRPMSYFQITFLRNLAWRVIRTGLLAPILVLLVIFYHGFLTQAHLNLGWQFWLCVVLGHLVSFTFDVMMAMIALMVTEVFSIYELYYVPLFFLSGQLFPVAVLPGWAQFAAKLFPFYYTTGAPTEMLVGRMAPEAVGQVLLAQCLWIAIGYAGFRVLWAKGLRHYTAVGM